MSEQSREQLEQQVAQRATTDPAFRQALVQDPRGTLQQEFGVEIPDNITVQVVEERPATFYLVLPPASSAPGQPLSEEEMSALSGGWTGTHCNCPVW